MINNTVKVAIVQENPIHDNFQNCLDETVNYVLEAVNNNAQLVVFGETWLTGYPAWLDHCPEMGFWDHPPTKKVYAQMQKNGVEVPGPATKVLGALARQHAIVIVIGVNEVVRGSAGNGTIYNTLLIFDEKGNLANHHRKLMPTHTERLVYGIGDGHGLKSVETSFGKIGGLICWEHWMPLTRQAMHNQGEHIHIALWPNVHEMLQLASRHYAFEGRTFVIAVGQIMAVKDLPKELKRPEHLQDQPDQLLLRGGSCVIGPDGKYLLEPIMDKAGIFYHEIENLDRIYEEKMALDVTGHYNRKDIFQLKVNRER